MSALRFHSSRGESPAVGVSEAMQRGLAPDGGLYMPERQPERAFADAAAAAAGAAPLSEIAARALRGFFEGDRLQSQLDTICAAALDIETPTTLVKNGPRPLYALELHHGPTAAFKDFGARFLAESLQLLECDTVRPMTILVATSGDTGGAVAAALQGRPWVRAVILYPKGLVSARQEQQLTCWGGNVTALRISGTFDDCQRLVKEAFQDAALRQRYRLSSANSINIGRLMPQMAYYMASSLELAQRGGRHASYIIPAGNLGNACAALWARQLGFPIGRIVLAHNANRTVPDYLHTGRWRPRPSVATLASAMDVGNPSNMERLQQLYPGWQALRAQLSAHSIDDDAIRNRIQADFASYGREWCPHTATAAEVYARLSPLEQDTGPWVLVATAHAAKFNDIVEPLIGKPVVVPDSLGRLLHLPSRCVDLEPQLAELSAALE